MTRKLAIAIRADDVAHVQAVAGSGNDHAILKLLREETAYLTLLVRLRNEERKAEHADQPMVVVPSADDQERLF